MDVLRHCVSQLPVTCESLVSREFSRILSTFHFSISISRHFHFTFHSRSRSQGIFISLFILEMSERKTKFTFQFSKRVKAFQISLFFLRKKSEIMHVSLHFVMKNNCSQCGVASFQARNLLNGCTFNMG